VVAPNRSGRLGAALVVILALAAALGLARATTSEGGERALAARTTAGSPHGSLRATAFAQVPTTWRGGAITASTGEVVRVFVSDSLPAETVTPEAWAEFLVGLTHGPELGALTTYLATLAEVAELCGDNALGCYRANRMVSLGETLPDGTTPEEVVRHEYGHHVGFHRQNPPWRAIDWGPKSWASTANVCARTARGEAYPGDGGRNYALNPGEAWAEVYRLMDERKAGITTATWQIVAPSFYPSDAALHAAERDVLAPWTGARTLSFRRSLGNAGPKVWWIPVSTPLDGNLTLTAALPRGGEQEVALVAGNRKTVLQRGQWVSQRAKRLARAVCGQRSLFVRVTQRGAPGPVRLTFTAP